MSILDKQALGSVFDKSLSIWELIAQAIKVLLVEITGEDSSEDPAK
jgi:hypothetical protein